mgnify:CR=1 FL=1
MEGVRVRVGWVSWRDIAGVKCGEGGGAGGGLTDGVV